jgi:hypothetical protein
MDQRVTLAVKDTPAAEDTTAVVDTLEVSVIPAVQVTTGKMVLLFVVRRDTPAV